MQLGNPIPFHISDAKFAIFVDIFSIFIFEMIFEMLA
jgi:hypothetical protein